MQIDASVRKCLRRIIGCHWSDRMWNHRETETRPVICTLRECQDHIPGWKRRSRAREYSTLLAPTLLQLLLREGSTQWHLHQRWAPQTKIDLRKSKLANLNPYLPQAQTHKLLETWACANANANANPSCWLKVKRCPKLRLLSVMIWNIPHSFSQAALLCVMSIEQSEQREHVVVRHVGCQLPVSK